MPVEKKSLGCGNVQKYDGLIKSKSKLHQKFSWGGIMALLIKWRGGLGEFAPSSVTNGPAKQVFSKGMPLVVRRILDEV